MGRLWWVLALALQACGGGVAGVETDAEAPGGDAASAPETLAADSGETGSEAAADAVPVDVGLPLRIEPELPAGTCSFEARNTAWKPSTEFAGEWVLEVEPPPCANVAERIERTRLVVELWAAGIDGGQLGMDIPAADGGGFGVSSSDYRGVFTCLRSDAGQVPGCTTQGHVIAPSPMRVLLRAPKSIDPRGGVKSRIRRLAPSEAL